VPHIEMKKYYDILELPEGSSLREVQNAYLRLRKLYTGDSIALAPLEEEFSEKKRKKILHHVEEAYAKIQAGLAKERPKADSLFPVETGGEIPELDRLDEITFSGPVMKKIRERLGLNENALCRELKLRTEFLQALEDERFELLPQVPYLKGHLKSYARFLGLKPGRVAEDYLRRFLAWKDKHKPAP
jgi:hypothetical protein